MYVCTPTYTLFFGKATTTYDKGNSTLSLQRFPLERTIIIIMIVIIIMIIIIFIILIIIIMIIIIMLLLCLGILVVLLRQQHLQKGLCELSLLISFL